MKKKRDDTKNIKIISHGESEVDRRSLRNTTIGKVYRSEYMRIETIVRGSISRDCPSGIISVSEGYYFLDDVASWISIFASDTTYELIEGDE